MFEKTTNRINLPTRRKNMYSLNIEFESVWDNSLTFYQGEELWRAVNSEKYISYKKVFCLLENVQLSELFSCSV